MTRTHEEHETLLAPYYNPNTQLIDTRAFIRDYNVDGIAAVYGPATGDPNEDTLQLADAHNRIVRAERSGDPLQRETERVGWLARFVWALALVLGAAGTFGSFAALVAVV